MIRKIVKQGIIWFSIAPELTSNVRLLLFFGEEDQ